jgi:hypothetical protein
MKSFNLNSKLEKTTPQIIPFTVGRMTDKDKNKVKNYSFALEDYDGRIHSIWVKSTKDFDLKYLIKTLIKDFEPTAIHGVKLHAGKNWHVLEIIN